MKNSVLKTLLSGLAVLLLINGCAAGLELFDTSVHGVEFSVKNEAPCFAPKNDSTLSQSAARIHTVSVIQNVDSNADDSSMWMVRWQDPVRLAQGECIQYGADAGRKPYAYPQENCTDPRLKPAHGGYKLLASGECVGDDEAQKLENGVTYFVSMEAQTDDSAEGEGHFIRDFFCLTGGKNGEATVHRLKYNMNKDLVETCPSIRR